MSSILKLIPIVLCTLLFGIVLNIHRIGDGGSEQVEVAAPQPPAVKIYTHHVAEGLSVQSGEFPGVKLVKFESCRIEKQRKGGFSFGAFNKLVIDDLEIAIPRVSFNGSVGGSEEGAGPLNRNQKVEFEFSKLLSHYPRFSSLEIRGLEISLAGGGLDQETILKARLANAGLHKTLELSECEFLSRRGVRIQSTKASLSLESPYEITTENGVYQIAGLAEGKTSLLTQFKIR